MVSCQLQRLQESSAFDCTRVDRDVAIMSKNSREAMQGAYFETVKAIKSFLDEWMRNGSLKTA